MSDDWEDAWENEEEEAAPRPVRRRRLPRNEQRSNLYILTGLVLGMVLGLVYAWLISPVKYVDNAPSSLAEPYKDEYRRLIALAYSSDKNLPRARERLALLEAGGSIPILASQAQRMLAENQPPQEARALALLAADLGKPEGAPAASGETPSPQEVSSSNTTQTLAAEPSPVESTLQPTSATEDVSSAVQTPTQPPPTRTPTITNTPPPTFTPRPTITPLPVQSAPFVLISKKEVCDGTHPPGLLQIIVTDNQGQPMPGVPILITWKDGQDKFFSGLAPDVDLGYADFQMSPNILYSLQTGETSEPIKNLTQPACGGGWIIEFQEGKE